LDESTEKNVQWNLFISPTVKLMLLKWCEDRGYSPSKVIERYIAEGMARDKRTLRVTDDSAYTNPIKNPA